MANRRGSGEAAAGVAALGTAAGANAMARGANGLQRRRIDSRIQEQRHLQQQAREKATAADKRRPRRGLNDSAFERRGVSPLASTLKQHETQIRQLREARKVPLIGRGPVQAATLGGLTLGPALLWHGARRHVEKRELTTQDVDRGALAGVAGGAAYFGTMYGSKPLDRKINAKVANDPRYRRVLEEHRAKHGITPNHPAGAKEWKHFFRDYPKEVPGARWKRVSGRVYGGKTGVVTAGTITGLSVALGSRHRGGVSKADQYLRRGEEGFRPRTGHVQEAPSHSMFGSETHHATSGYTGNPFVSEGPHRFREMPREFKGYERAAESKIRGAGRAMRTVRTAPGVKEALATGAVLTAGGLYAGHVAEKRKKAYRAQLQRRRAQQRAQQAVAVAKADLEVHDRRVSPTRVLGAAGGAAALTYGGSRLLGQSLVRGSKLAGLANQPMVERALLRGEDLRAAAVRRTAGAGGVGRLPYVGPLAQAVPKGARSTVATGAGVELLRHSIPVHRDRYRPATTNDIQGW